MKAVAALHDRRREEAVRRGADDVLADTEEDAETDAEEVAEGDTDAETDAEEVAEGDAVSETTGSHGEPGSNHWYSSTALWCPLGVVQISVAGVHAGCSP